MVMKLMLGAPTYNRYDLLPKLLRSSEKGYVLPESYIVIDNGVQPERVRAAIVESKVDPERVMLVEPGKNIGVAAAWNTILELADKAGARAVISNDDLEVARDTLETIAAAAESAELVRAPGFALFSIAQSAIDKLGYFDENFWPAYFEDNDMTYRARLAGISIVDPPVSIMHEGSASLKIQSQNAQFLFGRKFELLRAYYGAKWGGTPDSEKFTEPFGGTPPPGWTLRPVTAFMRR